MDIQEFNRRILQKRKQLEELVRRKMPVIAGNIAKRHIEDDFRKGGFTHNGFHPWQETRRQGSGRKGAGSRYGPLLSGREPSVGKHRIRAGKRDRHGIHPRALCRNTQPGRHHESHRHPEDAAFCLGATLQPGRQGQEERFFLEASRADQEDEACRTHSQETVHAIHAGPGAGQKDKRQVAAGN